MYCPAPVRGVPTLLGRRAARIIAAVALVASATLVVDLAGAATGQPTLIIADTTIERGTSTTFKSTFTMDEGTATATLNLPAGLTGAFNTPCDDVTPAAVAPARTCSMTTTNPGTVTVTNGGVPAAENVTVTISGTITASNDFALSSNEGAPPGTMTLAGLSITLDQGGPMTSAPPQSVTVTSNPGKDIEIQITTTAPAAGATAPRGGSISYTADLSRVGTPAALAQATTATATLVAISAAGTSPSGPATVTWAAGETGVKPVAFTVTVPTSVALATATYRIEVTYDPNISAGATKDNEIGVVRSFGIVAPAATLTLTPPTPAPGTLINHGDSFNLVATLVNPPGGDVIAPGVISVTVPAGLSVGPPPPSAAPAPVVPITVLPAAGPADVDRVVTVTYGTIADGQTVSLTIPVTVLASAIKKAAAPDLVVSASFNGGPPTKSEFEIRPDADLSLAISPASQDVQKNKPADVMVVVDNLGPDPATGIKTVTVTLAGAGQIGSAPPGSGCIRDSATQATCTTSADIPDAGPGVSFLLRVSGSTPGTTATLTAALATTGTEFDKDATNNANKTATVTFQQSSSDLSIAATSPVELTFGVPQNVTYTLTVSDPTPPNAGDPAEGVQVTIPIPAGLRATAANFTNGAVTQACTGLPADPGATVTCAVGDISAASSATVALTLQGTALIAATPVVATATSTNQDPTTPNTATALVTVVAQPVDLGIDPIADRIITTSGPAVTTVTGSFLVKVTNNSALFDAASYRLIVDVPAATFGDLELGGTGCTVLPPAVNIVICDATNLDKGTFRNFEITTNIKVPGPITVRSRADLLTTPSLEQVDPNSGNDTQTWTVTRNLPPDAKPDVGPTVPAGATVVFDVLNNDTDGDAADIPNLDVGAITDKAGLDVTVVSKKLRVMIPAGQAPATLEVKFKVIDGPIRGGSTDSSLKLRVVAPITETRDGSFGKPPAPPLPQSFSTDLDPARVGSAPTGIDVLKGDLGEDADAAPFSGITAYDVTAVDQASINVTGSTACPAPSAALPACPRPTAGDVPTDRSVVRYTPAPGYTSDPLSRTPTDLVRAPADSFKYTATGTRSGVELFTVESTATIEVRNQLPVGLDSRVQIFTASPSGVIEPAGNDIDGNTLATCDDPNSPPANCSIAVKSTGKNYVFDDEGKKDSAHGLRIACIGPVPTLDPVTGQPPIPGSNVCTEAGMKIQEQELEVQAPLNPGTTVSSGKIKATLVGNPAPGVTPFKTVKVSIDATVVGIVPFVAVVVDNYGGSAFSLVNIEIPNQLPEVIPGVQRVPENSPPVKVLDTTLPGVAKDNNGDLVKVSSVSDPEHGTATITSDAFGITYQPDKDYVGPDSLVLNVSDNRGVGSNSAQMTIDVFKAVDPLAPAGTGGTGAGGSNPAGNLAKTGGDPVPLTAAAGFSMLLGYGLVQASRRRRSLPLLDRARHLRA